MRLRCLSSRVLVIGGPGIRHVSFDFSNLIFPIFCNLTDGTNGTYCYSINLSSEAMYFDLYQNYAFAGNYFFFLQKAAQKLFSPGNNIQVHFVHEILAYFFMHIAGIAVFECN